MPDYVLKNKKTGGEYVLSLPHGADDEYRAEALAPLEAAGWVLDAKADPASVAPPIQQPPTVTPELPDTSEPAVQSVPSVPDAAPEPVQPEPTKEIS